MIGFGIKRGVLIAAAMILFSGTYCWAGPTFTYNAHWYTLVDSGSNGSWANAEANAVALGGHLVTINDAAEEAWLRSTFGGSERFWIGFTDAAVEGTWIWSSGESVTYANWDGGEPNECTPPPYGEDYAVLNWNSTTGAWNDWDHERPDYSTISGIAEGPVPEPGTLILLGTGLIGLAGYGFRRKKKT